MSDQTTKSQRFFTIWILMSILMIGVNIAGQQYTETELRYAYGDENGKNATKSAAQLAADISDDQRTGETKIGSTQTDASTGSSINQPELERVTKTNWLTAVGSALNPLSNMPNAGMDPILWMIALTFSIFRSIVTMLAMMELHRFFKA